MYIVIILLILVGSRLSQQVTKYENAIQEQETKIEELTGQKEKLEKEIDKKNGEIKKLSEAKKKREQAKVATKKTNRGTTKGVEQWRGLCEKHFGSKANECLMVMKGESGGNPNAVSHTDDHGLMQINAPTWTKFFGLTRAQLKDPDTNMKCARVIYDRAGGSWRPWVYARSIGLA